MAPKVLKIGELVNVLAHKVVGVRAAAAQYGTNHKTKRISSTITGCNGRGRLKKWIVLFAAFNKTKEFASWSLQISKAYQPSDSGNAAPVSGEISDPAASDGAVAVNDESL